MLTSDAERDRAAATLRDQFVGGRLTVDELSHRTGLVLAARSRREIRAALRGLPTLADFGSLAVHGRTVARGAVLALATFAYLMFTLAFLVVFGLVLLLQDPSHADLAAFLVVWLVPTWLLTRMWRRRS